MKKLKTEAKSSITICLILSILYFIAIADLEYGYYTFLRIISLLLLSFLLFITICDVDDPLLSIKNLGNLIVLILFNPIFPIYLDKDTWVIIDAICGSAMLIEAIYLLISKKSREQDDE